MHLGLRIESVFALGLLFSVSSAAAAFPDRPLEIIVPTTAGGGTDTMMRMLAERLSDELGQQVVVINKPGAGGTLGMAAILDAPPDGYTLGGLWSAPLVITPHTLGTPYKPGDYVAISQIDTAPDILCVQPDFPANNGQELIEEIRKHPGEFTYGTDGVGGTIHLVMERVFSTLGVEARPVPLSGAAESLTNFLGGHVTFYTGGISAVVPHAQAGKAKCLLVTDAKSVDVLPTATNLTELGIPEAATVLFRGLIGPKDMPAENVAVISAAVQKIVQSEEFRTFLQERGSAPVGSGPDEFEVMLRTEYEAIGGLVDKLGLAQKQ